MPIRLSKSASKVLLIAGSTLVVAGGFALAFVPTSRQMAKTILPQTSPSSPTVIPAPTDPPAETAADGSVPSVAGASTVAPRAASTPRPILATPAPTPAPHATLIVNGHSFDIANPDGLNACSILQRARDQGKISSVTITDKYLSTLQSRFVEEINSSWNNWVYKFNGTTAPYGCTHPRAHQIKAGDTVNWTNG